MCLEQQEEGGGAGCHGDLGGDTCSARAHTHTDTHMENWRSLASMLRCLMHILVRAEPMSLVPPEKKHRQTLGCLLWTKIHQQTHIHSHNQPEHVHMKC